VNASPSKTPRHVPLPWLFPEHFRSRCFRGSQGPHRSTFTSGEETICGVCGKSHRSFYDHKLRRVRDLSGGDTRICLEPEVRRVLCGSCGKVKREKLSWLADNPFYTKRFAFFVGRRCRVSTIRDVAKELHLDWKTVKELDKQFMREQLRRIGMPGPRIIGIDEVSIRKGHSYRIVVSDLVRLRPIWFGGQDRSEESMDQFYQRLGPKKSQRIQLP
jgi:transposase